MKVFPSSHKQIAESYIKGVSMNQLGREYGVNPSTIREIILREGVTPRNPGGRTVLTPLVAFKISESYSSGKSQVKISSELRVSQSVVSRSLREQGVVVGKGYARGNRHGNWKGGSFITDKGYRLVRFPQDCSFISMRLANGYIPEHRLAMANKLGRPLLRTEEPHHIDGDRLNNAPGNLQLRRKRHGRGVCMKCSKCGSFDVIEVPLTED